MNRALDMRIVQVSTADVGGGAERIAADLHRGSLRRGLDSVLAVGFRFDSIERTLVIPNDERRGAWARAVLRLAPTPSSAFGRFGRLSAVARTAVKAVAEPVRALTRLRGLDDFDYPGTSELPAIGGTPADILHLHNLHGGYFDLRCLPALSHALPVVLTAHDVWLASGHCAYAVGCDRWLTGCGDCPNLAAPPSVLRDRTKENVRARARIFEQSRIHLVGPSNWVLDQLQRSVFASAIASAHHISNGVDQRVFTPGDQGAARQRLGLPPDALIIVFSSPGGSNPYKDPGSVLRALPKISEGLRPRRVLFLSVGGAPAGTVPPGVDLVGVPYTPDPARVADHLKAADIAVHMAHAENQPLAILEALSCGLPVVASDVGGIHETIEDGVTGVLVGRGDHDALARAVVALSENAALRTEMGRAAASIATRRFGIERMVDEYLSLYQTLA